MARPRLEIDQEQLEVLKRFGLYLFEIENMSHFYLSENQRKVIDSSVCEKTRRLKLLQLFPNKKRMINYHFKNYKKHNYLENLVYKRLLTSVSNHAIQNKFRPISMNQQCLEILLGYSVAELITNISEKFSKGLSWDNMDEWHIDHIKPKSKFKFKSFRDESFLECWSLNNLRPLLAIDNLKKSNKDNDL
jgi:hypothetical protein